MHIQKLTLHPFKSLKGIDVHECEIQEHGFQYDRIYMLAAKTRSGVYNMVSQRTIPVMSLITQEIVGDQLKLTYKGEDNRTVETQLPLDCQKWSTDLPVIHMPLWGVDIEVYDVADHKLREFFVDFFSSHGINKFTTENLTVVVSKTRRMVEDAQKVLHIQRNAEYNFQDAFPGTIMTTASFEALAEHASIMDEAADPIAMDSFRMNILVDTEEPWIEDDWQRLLISNHEWAVLGPTNRCPMPAVDQNKGQYRKGRSPLPSLNRFRVLEKGKSPSFGMSIINEDWGYKIRVGDEIRVLAASSL